MGTLERETRIGPSYPHARRKRRLKLGGFSEHNRNIVEWGAKQPISLTHAPIMENKRFLSIHKIQIVCQYVHILHFSNRHQ